MVGFTGLACRLDPEDVRTLQTEYFRAAAEVIHRWNGVVEKYIGDAVMAVFGVPRSDGYDACRAVRAGMQLQEALSDRWFPDGQPVRVRVGIATGEALVDLAAISDGGQRFLSGDVVNTAARVQAHAGALVQYQHLDPVTVAGKPAPLDVWRPLEVTPGRTVTDRDEDVPLVGRQAELATIAGRIERAVRDRAPQLVSVVGAAGTGKSRLVRELARVSTGDATVWSVGRCSPCGTGHEALAEIVRGATADPTAGPGFSPEAEQEWQGVLLAAAARRPTVLVVEDLQRADAAVARFLRNLVTAAAGASPPLPLVVIVTYRPESAGLIQLEPDCRVSLGALGAARTGRLLRHLLDRAGQPATYAHRLLPLTGGNPMYAEAYVQMLAGGGLPAGPDLELPTPEPVRAVVSARLDQLRGADRTAVHAISVLGRGVSADALAFLLRTDRDDAYAILHRLERTQVLVRRSTTDPAEYTFSDPAMRAVAYARLPRAARIDHHRRAAGWLDALAGAGRADVARERARHWAAVLDLSRALHRDVAPYLRAARRAFADAARRRAVPGAATGQPTASAPTGRVCTHLDVRRRPTRRPASRARGP
jgi:hypothetical protein